MRAARFLLAARERCAGRPSPGCTRAAGVRLLETNKGSWLNLISVRVAVSTESNHLLAVCCSAVVAVVKTAATESGKPWRMVIKEGHRETTDASCLVSVNESKNENMDSLASCPSTSLKSKRRTWLGVRLRVPRRPSVMACKTCN